MSLCTCGSWRRTSFGLVCRQCGKHKQKKRTEKSSPNPKPESFEEKLKEIQQKHQRLDDGPGHHQVLSYEIVNDEIIVTSIVYDEKKAGLKQFPKSITTWKY